MKPGEQKAIETHFSQLVECLRSSVTPLLSYLQQQRIINEDEREVVDSKIISRDRTNTLLEILKSKDNGWSGLLSYLDQADHQMTAQELVAFRQKEEELKCLSKKATELTSAEDADVPVKETTTLCATADSNGATEGAANVVESGLASDAQIVVQLGPDSSTVQQANINVEPDSKMVVWDKQLGVCKCDVENAVEILAKLKDLERHGKDVEKAAKGLRGAFWDFRDKIRKL